MKRFATRRLITVLCATGMLGISSHAMAAGFQLYEQDGASIGSLHAGYSSEANDASTAWYNPAGMTRIKNQQIVYGAAPILSDFKFKGQIGVTEFTPTFTFAPTPGIRSVPATVNFNGVTDQGGLFSVIPFFHYVTPITDRLSFGFSTVAPFGLKTAYGSNTAVRYAATTTSVTVVDLTPSLAFRFNDNISVGAGFDAQRMFGEFDSVGAALSRVPLAIGAPRILTDDDTISTNRADDWAYGYHLGFLYEFTPCTRIGISYHSKVDHHLTGNSRFEGPIAGGAAGVATGRSSTLISQRATTDITLPAYTTVSYFNKVNPSWAWMAQATYTQWNVFDTLVLHNAAGAVTTTTLPFFATSTNFNVTIPEGYRNAWNLSVGGNWYAREGIILRAGLGWDQTPVNNAYRNLQLPDSDRYIAALGTHFQATKTIGFDLSYQHVFTKMTKVNPPPQQVGAQIIGVDGHVNGGADVFGAQVVWDLV